MTTTELHANMFDTIHLDRGIIYAPKWLNFFFNIFFSFFVLYVVLAARPKVGLSLILFSITFVAVVSLLGFILFNFNINVTQPLITIFACYYFFLPYRLISENRSKWELKKKNQILTQVEELKNNFLKMMSHDLKTPLARIQGMVEVVSSDKQSLSQRQTQAVGTIKSSAMELTDLITSILDLGRVENQGIQLRLQSKDINEVLKRSIESRSYLAAEKKIAIITELEPLFSIQVDEQLLRQVFINIIENAIKYSPTESKVLVTSEEEEGLSLIHI